MFCVFGFRVQGFFRGFGFEGLQSLRCSAEFSGLGFQGFMWLTPCFEFRGFWV